MSHPTSSVINIHDSDLASSNEQANETDRIKHKLDEYFRSGATLSLAWRKRQLNACLVMLQKEEKTFLTALQEDLHKSPEEAYITEVGYLIKDIRFALKHLHTWMKPVRKSTPMIALPAKSYIQSEPLGTCLVIGAWNYPLQLSLSPMIAAIAAGNCVILKPSELAPVSAALLAELLPKYMDMGAIAIINGGKSRTSTLLALAFDKIFYTGGEYVAKIVMAAAAKHLTPVTLELGGKSPCIVDKNIPLNTAIKRIVWGKFMNAGQTCIAPDYLLVQHSQLDDVVAELKKVIVKQYKKDPQANRFYGRIINKQHCARLVSYLDGQNVVYGGDYDIAKRYFSPTIVLNPDPQSPLMQAEIFGPIIPIMSFTERNEMLNFIKNKAKPLAAYIFTEDKEFEQECLENISAGTLCVNDTSMFMLNPELPFGGVGASGMGCYHGKYGFQTFSHQKSVLKRSFSMENSVRYMPLTKLKMWLLKRFIR